MYLLCGLPHGLAGWVRRTEPNDENGDCFRNVKALQGMSAPVLNSHKPVRGGGVGAGW